MDAWQVALISALAALAGASIGSVTQLRIIHSQQKQAALEARAIRKRCAYEDYLHFVMGLPEVFRTAFRALASGGPPAQEEVMSQFRKELNRLQVLLMLDASRPIQDGEAVVRASIGRMLGEGSPSEESDPTRGVHDTFEQNFRRIVLPEIETLASLMASELDPYR